MVPCGRVHSSTVILWTVQGWQELTHRLVHCCPPPRVLPPHCTRESVKVSYPRSCNLDQLHSQHVPVTPVFHLCCQVHWTVKDRRVWLQCKASCMPCQRRMYQLVAAGCCHRIWCTSPELPCPSPSPPSPCGCTAPLHCSVCSCHTTCCTCPELPLPPAKQCMPGPTALQSLQLLSGKLEVTPPSKEQRVVLVHTDASSTQQQQQPLPGATAQQPQPHQPASHSAAAAAAAGGVGSNGTPGTAAAAAGTAEPSAPGSQDAAPVEGANAAAAAAAAAGAGGGGGGSSVDGLVLSRRWYYTGPNHPLHAVEEGLREGCVCQVGRNGGWGER